MFQGANDDGEEAEVRVGRGCGGVIVAAAGVHLGREEFLHVGEGVEGEEVRRRRHSAWV